MPLIHEPQLIQYLRRTPMTAAQIAAEFGVSKPTAYKYLAALAERGDITVYSYPKSTPNQSGPRALVYGIR